MSDKVLLCAVNAQYVHSNPAVYALHAYYKMCGALFQADVSRTAVREFSINDTLDSILYKIQKEKADVLGFSVYIWNVSYVAKLCRVLKRTNPDVTIILGGPEVSYGLEHTSFSDDDYDYVICGEGERAFTALLFTLNGAARCIPHAWAFQISGKACSAAPIENLDEIPFLYQEEDMSAFSNKILYYETSRGCPFRCAYCLSSVCGSVRFLSMERIKKELLFFKEHGVRQVKFVDRTFNCKKERANEIWAFIIEHCADGQTNFHFEIGADLLDEKQLMLLKRAPKGLIQFEIGIQSTNEQTLRESARKTDTERVLRQTKALISYGNINIHVDLIAGLPYEGLESFGRSFSDVYALKANQLQLGFLKLLQGAPLQNMLDKHGYVFSPYPPYEVLSNRYISYDALLHLKRTEDCVEKFYNSQRFVRSLSRLEPYFENPFIMFEAIADYCEKQQVLLTPVSSRNLFSIFSGFARETMRREEAEAFDRTLLLDYYACEKSEVVPASLLYLVPMAKISRPVSYRLLHERNLHRQKGIAVRFAGTTAYIFDYAQKDPVNQRYACMETIENAFT